MYLLILLIEFLRHTEVKTSLWRHLQRASDIIVKIAITFICTYLYLPCFQKKILKKLDTFLGIFSADHHLIPSHIFHLKKAHTIISTGQNEKEKFKYYLSIFVFGVKKDCWWSRNVFDQKHSSSIKFVNFILRIPLRDFLMVRSRYVTE